MKTYRLEDLTDNYIGKKGTKKREEFEVKAKSFVVGEMIKEARKDAHSDQ